MYFHVTNEVFYDYVNGVKYNEYRDFTDYWNKRMVSLDMNDTHYIVRGYTKERLPIKILGVFVVDTDIIVPDKYRKYIKTDMCFSINIKFVKEVV